MKRKIEILLQHGWAFDKDCWRGWMPHLRENQDCEISIQTPDRGYFGEKSEATPFQEADSVKIVIAHSLGLHLVPEEILRSADLAVVASSFRSFHSGMALEEKRSRKKVSLIQKKLADSPMDLLNEFYSDCYHPLLTNHMLLMRNFQDMNTELLERDLDFLDNTEFDMQILHKVPKVLFVHGSDDIIVPASRSTEMNELLPKSDLILFEGAGHTLPLTHVAPVWISLRSKLRQLLSISSKNSR